MSLVHQTFTGTDAEADATVRASSPMFRAMVTPWPWQRIVEGAVMAGAGVWVGIAFGSHNVLGGVGAFLLCVLCGVVVAAPGFYTLRHRGQAEQFFAASRAKGDRTARLHPYAMGAGFVIVGALAGAFGGHSPHQSAGHREAWAVAGAVFGLVVGGLRVRAGRRRRPSAG